MSLSVARPYIVAVDIGTTSTKTLVIRTADGYVVAGCSIEYPMFTPRADIAEQDPEQIFQAVTAGIHAVIGKAAIKKEQILCVSFSSAMHGLIAMDAQGKPLTRLITWADNRAVAVLDEIKREHNGHGIYLRTGTPIHPMSPFLKLVWMKSAMPEIHAAAHKFIGIKEYIMYRWLGRYVVDYSIASATGLFNLEQLAWDEEALRLAGITADRLSEPVSTVHVLEGIHPALAAEMGLPSTPVVAGASDGVLANLGSGAFEPGVWAVSIGTSGAVRAVTRTPKTDPEGRLFCYALKEDFWVVGGAINNGGIMFRWVRDTLATLEAAEGRRLGMDPYDYLAGLAAEVPAGSDGLIFLPFLAGERAPYWNANARGVFFGLSLVHQKKHMIRAVLEGVMYRIHSVAEALTGLLGEPSEIRASGGFARSPFWRQIMVDVLGTPATVPNAIEASGLGAAQLGLFALGEIEDFSLVHDWVKAGQHHVKQQAAFETYKRLTPIYQKVYHQLSREFDEIAKFQQELL
ncbi:MAG: gluconokinase [Paenibacillaceae bacterium]|jgi:gluconokinase|nr:gluconokinase [Paenibacillaceae bacterium]